MKFITDYLQAKKDNVVLRQKITELQQSVGDTAKLYNNTFEQLTKVTGKYQAAAKRYKEVLETYEDTKVELQEAYHNITNLKNTIGTISTSYTDKIDLLKYRKRILCKKYKLIIATFVCIITAQSCYILSHILGV